MTLSAETRRAGAEARCAGAVLAGGASSRMGADKAFLEIDGATMAARAAQALLSAGVGRVFLVGGDPALGAATGLRGVADLHPGAGPLGAVLTALHAAGERVEAVVTMPCDVIEPDPRAVRAVLDGLGQALAAPDARGGLEFRHAGGSGTGARRCDAGAGGCPGIVVPVADDGPQWLHAAWRRTCLDALSAAFALGERAPRRAVADLCVVSVEVAGSAWRRDADRPEDLPPAVLSRRARASMSRPPSRGPTRRGLPWRGA